jgi:hypothetical protein
VSRLVLERLSREPESLPPVELPPTQDALGDEDLQLALYLLYELHYRGLPGVSEGWEWEPSLLALRAQLEDRFEQALRRAVPPETGRVDPGDIDLALRSIVEADDGPSLSVYVQSRAGIEQFREFVIHRSAYQLKEADPHSWAIPRLSGRAKAALLEIQFDEYGRGRADRIHAELFAQTMRALGLDATYGAYLDRIPAVTLATVNLMSLLGLHRRLRAAIIGHLAAFEMTSSIPNRRYANGLKRLGYGPGARRFFEEHVEADAVHENVAAVDLAGGLITQEPDADRLLLWGARSLIELEARWASHLLSSWEQGRSSLLVGPAGGAEADQLVRPVAERLDLGSAAAA